MKRVYYGHDGSGKLVRDNQAEVLNRQGYPCQYRNLSKDELASAIVSKMPEEVEEIKVALNGGSRDELIEEIADLQELVGCLVTITGLSPQDIKSTQDQKRNRRGSFLTGQFMEYIDLPQTAQDYEHRLNYFTNRPDGYIVKDVDEK